MTASGSVAASRLPPLVADVDDRALGLGEEGGLRLVVGLHRAVEVEVVLRQVREDEHGEARAARAGPARPPPRSPRARTRRSPASAISRSRRWRSIASGVLRPVGRGSPPTRRSMFVSRPELPSRRLEDRVDQERGRRLAVRAGDRGDIERRATGSSKKRSAATGIAARTSPTTSCGNSTGKRLLDDERRRAARRRRPARTRARRRSARARRRRARPA